MNESGDKTEFGVPIGQDAVEHLDVDSPAAPPDRSAHWRAVGGGRYGSLHIEQSFDQEQTEGGERDDEDREGETRRLRLLTGGLRHTVPTGEPMPSPPAVTFTAPVLRDTARHHEPLRRYRAPLVGAPVWSADATWSDLTVRHEVPPLPVAPPAGWTRDWAVTYRHGKSTYTAPVGGVAEADLCAADPIRVNSWHRNKTARAGLRFLESTGEHHSHESFFERKLLVALDFHGVDDVLSQPFTLTWHDGTRERSHTPDFLVMADGNLTVVNCRPLDLVKPRLLEDCAAVAELAFSRGWDHALVVGYPSPGFTIIDTVSAHARARDPYAFREAILSHLTSEGPIRFGDLTHRLDSAVLGRAVLQRLIWDREVTLDLRVPLEDHTVITLPGLEF